MKLVSTIKLKVNLSKDIYAMSKTFTEAVQYAIDKGFEAKIKNRFSLHHLVYKDLRKWLPADFACEAIAKASENLKATKKRPIMKKPTISFNRKLFTFSFDKVRIATFVKRQRLDVPIDIPEYYWKYLDWRYQTLEIIKDRKNRMFFHITFSREVGRHSEQSEQLVEHVPGSCGNKLLGVDLGVNNLAVCSDGQVFTGYKTKIKQFQFMRRRLQAKGTKSARRKLVSLGGRQKRYMAWVNHNVSKQIVSTADCIILENLKGIRKSRNKYMSKRLNRWFHSWSFYQLQQFIKYKAEREGKTVEFVNPYMTSQICSNCGKLGSRYSSSFVCLHCNSNFDADFNASCNLRRLHVTQPIVSDDDAKGQLITAAESRDNQSKSVMPLALARG